MKVILADPEGSGLYNKVRFGVLYDPRDAEGHRTRVFTDTIVEGVGINRLTRNFAMGLPVIDEAYKVSDLEAVHMSRYLIAKEGLFLGSSSALNCCALVKAVKAGCIEPGSRVVLLLCDSGVRHLSRLYNASYLASRHLLPRYLQDEGMPAGAWEYDAPASSNAVTAALCPSPPQSVFEFID